MNYRYLLVLLFLAPLSQVSAQKNKSKNNSSSTRTVDGDLITVEFDSKESDGDFKTITLGNEGAIVYYDKKDSKKGIEEYEFVKLDKELNEVYRKTYAMPKNSTIISSTENNGKVYLLIAKNTRKTSYSYVHFKEYILVKFDPVSQKFSSFDGALSKGGGYFQQLEVLNDAAYINVMKAPSMSEIQLMLCLNLATCFIPYITGLTKVKYKPEFIVHNMETKQQRNVPFGYEKRKGNTVVQSFSIDDSTMEATLLIGTTQKKVSSMAIRQVDANAKIGKEMLLKLPANKLLSDVRIASFEDKKKFYLVNMDKHLKLSLLAVMPKEQAFQLKEFHLVLLENQG